MRSRIAALAFAIALCATVAQAQILPLSGGRSQGVTLIAHLGIAGGSRVGAVWTSAATDTTGANFLVMIVTHNGAATVADRYVNTWALAPNAGTSVDIWYTTNPNPTVGPGHTFSSTGSQNLNIEIAFAVKSPPYVDQSNTASSAGTDNVQTGSVTPTTGNQLLIVGAKASGAGTDWASIDSSFTKTDSNSGDGATFFGTGAAYQIQTGPTTRNPTVTFAGASGASQGTIVTFR